MMKQTGQSIADFLRGHKLGEQLDAKMLQQVLPGGDQAQQNAAVMVNRLCSMIGIQVPYKAQARFVVDGSSKVCTLEHPYWKQDDGRARCFRSGSACTSTHAAYEAACKTFLTEALLECTLPVSLNAPVAMDPIVKQLQDHPKIVEVLHAHRHGKEIDQWIDAHVLLNKKDKQETKEADTVVAFDLEWHPWAKTLQLIQLASPDGHCLLVRTHAMDSQSEWPQRLVALFAASNVHKIGLCIQQDLLTLAQTPALSKFQAVTDILNSAKLSGKGYSPSIGQSKLMRYELGTRLPHSKRITLSNFGKPQLSAEQIEYAALDAICVLRLLGTWPTVAAV